MSPPFKLVSRDLTSFYGQFSYHKAVQTGEWLDCIAIADRQNLDPCPLFEGDGFCVAKSLHGATSGGQSVGDAVGLLVEYDDVLGEDPDKLRVARLRVTGMFDPVSLIAAGLCKDMYGTLLRGIDLRDADLTYAALSWSNLTDANLTRANLSHANLTRAVLEGADLTGADLSYAVLTDAYMDAVNLTDTNLTGVVRNW